MNKGAVWLGEAENTGLPLLAGEERTLAIQTAITLTGRNNDQLYLAELITEEDSH